jgi:hypothetical protein
MGWSESEGRWIERDLLILAGYGPSSIVRPQGGLDLFVRPQALKVRRVQLEADATIARVRDAVVVAATPGVSGDTN